MSAKKTLVLGASLKDWRASHDAVLRLAKAGHPVIAVGLREGKIGEVNVTKQLPSEKDFDTVTLYLNERNQKKYYDYILSLKPRRIIFNPGAENPELTHLAETEGIETLNDCTLIMLSAGLY